MQSLQSSSYCHRLVDGDVTPLLLRRLAPFDAFHVVAPSSHLLSSKRQYNWLPPHCSASVASVALCWRWDRGWHVNRRCCPSTQRYNQLAPRCLSSQSSRRTWEVRRTPCRSCSLFTSCFFVGLAIAVITIIAIGATVACRVRCPCDCCSHDRCLVRSSLVAIVTPAIVVLTIVVSSQLSRCCDRCVLAIVASLQSSHPRDCRVLASLASENRLHRHRLV